MKLDLPTLPENLPSELRSWIDRAVALLNKGRYAPKEFSSAPAVGDMETGEMAWGNATGASSEHEIFVKVDDSTIARWTHDATIT